MTNPVPLRRLVKAAMVLETILGIGAVGGGITLMAGPNGEILPLPVAALAGSPFSTYFAPGAILFAILGLGPLGAAILARRRHPLAPFLMFAAGGALLIWLIVEIAVVGYSNHPPLQALYLGLGVVMAFIGVAWIRQIRRSPLSILAAFPLALLVAVASLAGILFPSTYAHETASWAAQAIGQDWVDLLIAVPCEPRHREQGADDRVRIGAIALSGLPRSEFSWAGDSLWPRAPWSGACSDSRAFEANGSHLDEIGALLTIGRRGGPSATAHVIEGRVGLHP